MRAPPLLLLLTLSCSGEDVVLGDGAAPAEAAPPVAIPVFQPPTLVLGLEAANDEVADDDPSLTADGSELYFNSDRGGNEDIWRALLGGDELSYSGAEALADLNTGERETGIAISADGLSLWFSSDRDGGGLHVYQASRDDRDSPWGEALLEGELVSDGDDLVSSVSPNQRELYLARRSSSNEDYDLFVARRASSTATWEPPIAIAELNDDGEQSDAFALFGGALLLFTQDQELVASVWDDGLGAFAPPVPLADLNSEADDRDIWATPELDRVVFSSDRSGRYQLYQAERR